MHKLSQNDHIDTHTHKHRHRETLDMHGSEREIMFRQREVFVSVRKRGRHVTCTLSLDLQERKVLYESNQDVINLLTFF